MSDFERIPCEDGSYLEVCDAADGSFVLHAISPKHGAMTPLRLGRLAEKVLSVKLQLRERARIERRRKRG